MNKTACSLQGVITLIASSEGVPVTLAMLRSSRFLAFAETAGPRRAAASSQTPPQPSPVEQPADQPATDQRAECPFEEQADAQDAATNQPRATQASRSSVNARAGLLHMATPSPEHALSSDHTSATAHIMQSPGRLQEGADSIGLRPGRRTGSGLPADDPGHTAEGAICSGERSGAVSRAGSAASSDDDRRQSLLPAIVRCASPPPASEHRASISRQRDAPAASAIAPAILFDTVQIGNSLSEAASQHSATCRLADASAQVDTPTLPNGRASNRTPRSPSSSPAGGASSVPCEDGASSRPVESVAATSPAVDSQPLAGSAPVTLMTPAAPAIQQIDQAASADSESSGFANPAAVEPDPVPVEGSVEDDVLAGAPGDGTSSEASEGSADTGGGSHSGAGTPNGGSKISSGHRNAQKRHDPLDAGEKHAHGPRQSSSRGSHSCNC